MRRSGFAFLMLLAGCIGFDRGERERQTPHVEAHCAEQLIAAGIPLTPVLTVEHSAFDVPDHVYDVTEGEIHIFEFRSEKDATDAAKEVSADGSTIGTMTVHWIAPPRYYRSGHAILVQLGGNEDLSAALEKILSPPFATPPDR